jgi:hypothetical protein
MTRRLDLTGDKAVEVRRILVRNLTDIRKIRTEYRPLVAAQLEKTLKDLETVLTPDQSARMKKRYQRLLKFWLPQDSGDPSAGPP